MDINLEIDLAISRREFLQTTGAIATASLFGKTVFAEGEPNDKRIVRAGIYPPIGIARVGNSEEPGLGGYFIGPEVVEPPLTWQNDSRDKHGALKRQAARFRIYGFNEKDEVVRELTLENSDIEWRVHVANKKSEWYRFQAALDIREMENGANPRRNPKLTGDERKALVINPGARRISGREREGADYQFDRGRFQGVEVNLGELRTDSKGRLLFLGGKGKAASPANKPIFDPKDFDTFNNADGWFDDISDGPVDATVKVDGKSIPVEGAWVAVCPPNYAPNVIGWRTLHDLLINTYVTAGMMEIPKTTSFTHDVLPILQRLSNLQWVNKGFADTFGKGTEFDFTSPEKIAELAQHTNSPQRRDVAARFRKPGARVWDKKLWPMIYGDAYGEAKESENTQVEIPPLTRLHLESWVNGNYINDWDKKKGKETRIEQVNRQKQPEMLTRAALHFCLADAFHPGCELTWPMRHVSMYSAPFRIKRRAANEPERDYGETLTAAIVTANGGPLEAQGPGDLSKWMAIPWHGDTAFCRSGYEPEFDPYLPTFWPARVPNHVLSEVDFATVMDTTQEKSVRLDAFKRRANWLRHLTGPAPEQMVQMVSQFSAMGVIEARKGPKDLPEIPEIVNVETLTNQARALQFEAAGTPKGTPKDVADEYQKAGWEDKDQFEEFRALMFRRHPRPKP